YAEWLWTEHEGKATVQQIADRNYDRMTWTVKPGDPGPEQLFSQAVYIRRGLTVHAGRKAIGAPAFCELLKAWTTEQRNGNGTTEEFIATAEKAAGGKDL